MLQVTLLGNTTKKYAALTTAMTLAAVKDDVTADAAADATTADDLTADADVDATTADDVTACAAATTIAIVFGFAHQLRKSAGRR